MSCIAHTSKSMLGKVTRMVLDTIKLTKCNAAHGQGRQRTGPEARGRRSLV